MELSALLANSLVRDIAATAITFAIALSWLKLVNTLAQRGWLEQKLSRKIIHIGTGPLFVLCWHLYSEQAIARYFAALVPLAITLQFLAIGTELIADPAAVQAMTREGKPAEILRGPLYYGIAFILCTVLFWRNSPIGILALMLMCGGDGLADIVGRRLGKHKLPFSSHKSWAGSTAMFLGSFGFGLGFLTLFNHLGHFQPPLNLANTTGAVAAIAFVATLVEALPFPDIDNITLVGVAIAMGLWLL
ncbi:diacylglycerol/polyprenol kinase family protein [Trichocoleus sp. FACHB-262]|uniref:diacylglycerol/polyprenol kinase family protein n=1 Tax=Trichocoleus sp. FACHB-262 TaxID=2692869 RepID=UPI001682B1FA|nr:phosphatidate cytidylyltransferase [Trichocoleus sp. FACHB-262]MBD2120752.1 phosphatidate cytidylyltransferase [Trichocoleus sp. FACHB-262]